MAKYGKSLAQVVVEINGQKQVNNILNAMKGEAEKLRESLKGARKELAALAEGEDMEAHNKKLKEVKAMEQELKQLDRSIKETEKVNLNLDDILANTSKYSATVLNNTRKKIEATLRAMKPVTEEQRQQMRQMQQDVRDLTDEINRRLGKVTAFEDIMGSISRVDDKTLDGVIKRLKELISTTDSLDGEKIMKYKEQLAFAEETKRQRTLSEGRKLMGKVEKGIYQDTIEGTQQSIKLLEEYKKALKTTDSKSIENVNKVIEQLKTNIKETESGFLSFDDAMKRAQGVMDGTFKPTIEDLEKIQKTLKEGMQQKFQLSNPEDEKQLKETLSLMEEMAKKQQEVMRLNHQSKVDAVSGNLDKVSPAEIEEAVKAAKELQQVAKTKEEFIELGTFIGKATDRLKDWSEASKKATMKEQIKDLSAIRALSDGALQEQTKFWEGAMNGAKKTTGAYKEAKKNFEALQQESKRRLQFEGEQAINKVKLGEGDGSIKQMQERLKILQDYRAIIDGTKPDAYKSVDEAILKLTEDIKASQAGFLSFDDALKRAQGVADGTFKPTLEDLEKIQKVLKEGMQSKFQLSNPEDEKRMKETLRLMDEMTKKQQEAEQLRLKDQAKEVMAGRFTKTIEGTKQAIELLKKYQGTLDITKPDAIEDVNKKIREMNELLETASKKKAAEVMADPMKFSVDELNEAIKLTEKLQSATNDTAVWQKYEEQLVKAKEARDRFADDSKFNTMLKQFEDLEKLSTNAYAEQKKYWEGMRDSGKHYDEAIAKLKEMAELEQKRLEESANKVMGGEYTHTIEGTKQAIELLKKYQATLDITKPDAIEDVNKKIREMNELLETASNKKASEVMADPMKFSVDELNEAIKLTEKLQSATNDTTVWQKYEEQLVKAKEARDRFADDTKFNTMLKQFEDLEKLSTNAYAEQKKYWEGMRDSGKYYDEAIAKLKEMAELEQKRLEESANKVMGGEYTHTIEGTKQAIELLKKYQQTLDATDARAINSVEASIKKMNAELDKAQRASARKTLTADLDTAGTQDIKQAVDWLTKYQGTLKPLSPLWQKINKEIEAGNERLKKLTDGVKMDAMAEQFKQYKTLSVNALAEQKKYWMEVKNSYAEGTSEYDKAIARLDKIKDLEQSRTKADATKTIADVTAGSFDKTIEETQQAIKLIEEYKKQLKTKTDADAIEEANKAIEILNGNLGKAKEALMAYDEALQMVRDAGEGKFDGTAEELEKAKKSLEAFRKTLKMKTDAADIEEIDKALQRISDSAMHSARKIVDLDSILGRLDTASMDELQQAAKQLQQKLDGASRKTAEYAENAAKLRQVNLELKRAKKEWEGQESVITRTAKRLMAYVAVYGGWNEIWGQTKRFYQANLELSDSLADIQKTTGLSADSVAKLSDQINAIDTRTAQKELHDLAYEAGKLGISAEEDVLAFVRAGNQLLVALGEDLGGAEAVRELMKVNAILGETQKLGVEKALLATGSAINEISQTSRASAGPIADMVSRIGAIGAASNMSMSDLVALAGTADALAQSAEVAGTAFNKFMATLQSNPADVAYALGMDPGRLKSLMDSGETMTAVIEIFERMNLKEDMAELAPIMGELGSEGARMTQVLTTMAQGVEELKAQVFTSKQAFKEATSVTNEYNIKNESAAAIVERMGNNIKEMFTNSTLVNWLKTLLQWLYYFPNALERNRFWLLAIRTLLWDITAVVLVKLVATLRTSLVGALGSATLAWKSFYVQAAAAMFGIDRGNIYWRRMTLHCIATTSAIGKLRIAFMALGKVMLANPIMTIGMVIGGVVAAIQHFSEETRKAVKAVAEYEAAVRKEQFELDNLRIRIDRANKSNGERAALIQQLNNKYGQYLGFLVTEENYLRNQEYIYKLLNKEIERSIALKMQEKLVSDISSKYADKQLNAYEKMTSILNVTKGIGEGGARSAMSLLMESIKEQAKEGTEDVTSILHKLLLKTSETYEKSLEEVNEKVRNGELEVGSEAYLKELEVYQNIALGAGYHTLKNAISEMHKIETSIAQEAATAAELTDSNIRSIEQSIQKIKKGEVDNILSKIGKTENTKELQEYQSKLNSYMRQRKADVQALAEKQAELNDLTFSEESQLDKLAKKKEQNIALTEAEQATYDLLLKKQNKQVELTGEEGEQLKKVNAEIAAYQEGLDKVEGKLAAAGKLNLWGDGKTIADMDVNQLVAKYKQLESDGAKIGTNAAKEIQTAYWKGFQDQKKAIAWYKSEAEKIKAELESRGYNTSGKFKWSGEGGGKKTANELYKEWLAELEAYYNERETLIRQNGMKQNKLESEINRELEALNTEKLAMQREFSEGLLSDLYKDSTFDPSKFEGVITKTKYLAGLTMEGMREVVAAGGPKLEAEIRKAMTNSMVELEKQTYKIKQRIDKILLEDDFTGKVFKEYETALDELGLLFNIKYESQSKRTEKEGEMRLAYMRKWAKDSYQLTASALQAEMEKEKLFGDWVIDRKKEDYEALLIQLRKFRDDELEAEKKAADRRKKLFDSSAKGMAAKETGAANEQGKENEKKMWERFQGLGLISENEADRAQIELYEEKIRSSMLYIDQIKLEMAAEKAKAAATMASIKTEIAARKAKGLDVTQQQASLLEAEQAYNAIVRQEGLITLEARQNIAEQQALIADTEMAIQQRNIENVKQYTDAVIDFAGKMTEAEWDDVESRKEAGKELIKTLLTLLKNQIQIWTTELVMKKMFAQQSTATTAGQVGTEMTLKAAETEADIVAGTASATAKEAGKKGWIGLAVGAAIGAALSALLGLAMNAINKTKSTADSISGSKKLSTGMLTYADGNYPVLGNDGKVYDAKYEGAGMKTGVYGGGAHFGIFSEKQPEMIVDGKTTQKIILNYPYIYDAITTIAKNGRLKNAMPTFAAGDYPAGMKQLSKAVAVDGGASSNDDMIQMRATMEESKEVNRQLLKLLQGGITAHLDGLETHRQQKKNERFLKRRGID